VTRADCLIARPLGRSASFCISPAVRLAPRPPVRMHHPSPVCVAISTVIPPAGAPTAPPPTLGCPPSNEGSPLPSARSEAGRSFGWPTSRAYDLAISMWLSCTGLLGVRASESKLGSIRTGQCPGDPGRGGTNGTGTYLPASIKDGCEPGADRCSTGDNHAQPHGCRCMTLLGCTGQLGGHGRPSQALSRPRAVACMGGSPRWPGCLPPPGRRACGRMDHARPRRPHRRYPFTHVAEASSAAKLVQTSNHGFAGAEDAPGTLARGSTCTAADLTTRLRGMPARPQVHFAAPNLDHLAGQQGRGQRGSER
jgi:hypothetical protein